MGGQDPYTFAADMIVRILTLKALELIPLACVLVPLAYLHARWSRKG